MNQKTFIFIGRSGCGKGTQAKLLLETLAIQDTEKRPIFYVETGARFREFIKGEKLSNTLAAEVNKIGARQPDFLAVWNWAHFLIEDMTGKEHIVFDGTPRSLQEAIILDGALEFYKREHVVVIYIDVSREWSMKHLLARGRMDDRNDEEITNRLNWFDKDVLPAVSYFRDQSTSKLLEINGEQSIEAVHKEIIDQLAL